MYLLYASNQLLTKTIMRTILILSGMRIILNYKEVGLVEKIF